MSERIETYQAEIHLNPLGNLHAEVEIDPQLTEFKNRVLILHRGGYTYDYQTFRGILWPLSSTVREITAEIESAYAIAENGERIQLSADHRRTKTGGDMLTIPLSDLENNQNFTLFLEFVVNNIINRDILYHEMVYALTPPEVHQDAPEGLKNKKHLPIDDLDIEMSIHFAFGIMSGALRSEKFDLETGNQIVKTSSDWLPTHGRKSDQIDLFTRDGDIIKSRWNGDLSEDEELDLHVQGSPLPMLANIARPAFWGVIWIMFVIIFFISTLSPLF